MSADFDKLADRLEKLSGFMELDKKAAEHETLCIDAELPKEYMTSELLQLVDRFEPYGEANPPLCSALKNSKYSRPTSLREKEKAHLKLTFDCGKNKWPAFFGNSRNV